MSKKGGWIVPQLQDPLVGAAMRTRAIHLFAQIPRLDMQQSRTLEYHAFNTQPRHQYGDKCKQLYFNLNNNPMLLDTYDIDTLVHLSDEDLAVGTAVEKWRQEYEKTKVFEQNILLQKQEYDKEEQKMDSSKSTLVCGHCHSRDIDTDLKQTRGADEPMTCFCLCKNCGKRWRM
ncbi:MAG: hypothetical protein K0U52_06335 [Gammaproteobacteria bacterium]|nr:hypothetical protein [Gammaproteobacteria bacterium]